MRGTPVRRNYNTNLARALRRDPSRAERKIWEFVRSRHIAGAKFRRQHPIGPYVADFACVEAYPPHLASPPKGERNLKARGSQRA